MSLLSASFALQVMFKADQQPGNTLPYARTTARRGVLYCKGTQGCAARKGILFRTSDLSMGTIFGNFGLDNGMLFGNFGQRKAKFF